jgi:hypothetical protein
MVGGVPMPVPRGQFAEQQPLPHSPHGGVIVELLASLTGDPGLRVAETTSRPGATFTGSLDGVQRFTRPASPNQEETLEAAVLAVGVQRRALSRTRGRPGTGERGLV